MLVSHAHSFRQQARLAVTLAWIAGYTDILTLLACGAVTSHVSGTTAMFGRDVFSGSWGAASFAAYVLIFFFVGAGVSGFCTELGRSRGWESIFVLPMAIEAGLLGIFAFGLFFSGPPGGHAATVQFIMIGVAAASMGLQNATITQISRGHVRTTHVTGVLTDLGQEFVQYCWWLRDTSKRVSGTRHRDREHPAGRRLLLLASILSMFAFGAGLGTLMHAWRPSYAMFPPVLFLLWIIYQDVAAPIAEIEAANIESFGMDLPSTLAVYRLRRHSHGTGQVLRIPNLLAWSDRLSPETRVVVLDVAEIAEFNANALLEMKALLERFDVTDRTLIIAGLNSQHAKRFLGNAGHAGLLDHICSDLDLAVARGLNHVNLAA